MTVILEGSIKRFIGLSTDVKPSIGYQLDGTTIPAGDLPAGSSFLELDTGRIYRWDGFAAWTVHVPDLIGADLETLMTHVIYELRALRLGMIMAGTCVNVDDLSGL